MWVELDIEDNEKVTQFYEEIKKIPEIETISKEQVLWMNTIMVGEQYVGEQIADKKSVVIGTYGGDGQYFKVSDMKGNAASGSLFSTEIIGLDEQTFYEYAKMADLDAAGMSAEEGYPAIAENYLLTKDKDMNPPEYHFEQVLKDFRNTDLEFAYGKYADLSGVNLYNTMENLTVQELKKGRIHLLGTTQKAPPIPRYPDMDISLSVTGRTLRLYMPEQAFERLLSDPEYSHIHGERPQEIEELNYEGENPVLSYIKFDIRRGMEKEETGLDKPESHYRRLVAESSEDAVVEEKIQKIAKSLHIPQAEEDGYVFGSAAQFERDHYATSKERLIQILGYGIILLMTACAFTSMMQKITVTARLRQKEYAIYQTLGMSKKQLSRMAVIENALYGVSTGVFGIPFSIFLMYQSFKRDESVMILKIPYHIIIVECIIVLAAIIIPAVYALRQQKHLTLETARSENL